MNAFGKSLNRIVQGREESAEEIENVANKKARGLQDKIVHEHEMQGGSTKDFSKLRRILVIRGYVGYSFDPATGDWERLSDARRDRSYFETVLLGNHIYAIGSMNVTDAGTVERFVLSENRWENVAALPAKIRSVAAAVVPTTSGDAIYVCGGIDVDSLVSTDKVYVYNALTGDAASGVGSWTSQNDTLLTPRYRHASVIFENNLWIMGGIVKSDDGVEYTATTELMNCTTGVWSKGPTMCARRAIDVAPIVIRGVLYVLGGNVGKEVMPRGQCVKIIGTIERYDSAKGEFVEVATFPHQRKGFSGAALPNDDNIYCFGGREDDTDLTTWDAYNVATNKWKSEQQSNDLDMPFMDSLYGRAISMIL